MADIIFSLVRNMDFKAPLERVTIDAGTAPAVSPEDALIAIVIVESTRAGGMADARLVAIAAATIPTGRAKPRRLSWPLSRSRARDKRELTVPTGRPNRRAASSCVSPWMSQSTIVVRYRSGNRSISSWSASISSLPAKLGWWQAGLSASLAPDIAASVSRRLRLAFLSLSFPAVL